MLPKHKQFQNEGIKGQQIPSSSYFEKAPTTLSSSTLQVFIKRIKVLRYDHKAPGKGLLENFYKDLFEQVPSSVEGVEFLG